MNRTPEKISTMAKQASNAILSPKEFSDDDKLLIIDLIDEYMWRIQNAIAPYPTSAIPYILYAMKSVSVTIITNQSANVSLLNLQVFKKLTDTVHSHSVVRTTDFPEGAQP